MNWLDIVIVAGLIAGIVLGFRRGFIREAMGLLGLIVGVIIAVNYVDWASAKFLTHMRVSPHIISFFSFILLFTAVFLGFKILGFLFYRVGSLTALGKLDKVGGGIFGFLQARNAAEPAGMKFRKLFSGKKRRRVDGYSG